MILEILDLKNVLKWASTSQIISNGHSSFTAQCPNALPIWGRCKMGRRNGLIPRREEEVSRPSLSPLLGGCSRDRPRRGSSWGLRIAALGYKVCRERWFSQLLQKCDLAVSGQ